MLFPQCFPDRCYSNQESEVENNWKKTLTTRVDYFSAISFLGRVTLKSKSYQGHEQ